MDIEKNKLRVEVDSLTQQVKSVLARLEALEQAAKTEAEAAKAAAEAEAAKASRRLFAVKAK